MNAANYDMVPQASEISLLCSLHLRLFLLIDYESLIRLLLFLLVQHVLFARCYGRIFVISIHLHQLLILTCLPGCGIQVQ